MKIKTYGIFGLSEWHGSLKAGSISVKVSFTGGTVSPTGAQPAYLVTKDPITQFVIENSKEYKEGFIFLEMSVEKPGTHPREAVPTTQPVPTATEEGAPANAPAADGDTDADGGNKKVSVASKADAIEWLKENYPEKGYTAVKLRTKTAFEEACNECGVSFDIAGE